METSQQSCSICGSETLIPAFQGKDLLHHVEGLFDVVECKDCGTFSRLPRLTYADLRAYYPAETYKAYVATVPWMSRIVDRIAWARKRRYVTKFAPKGRLLDVGCGAGRFLDEMQRSGWDVEGVEPGVSPAQVSQNRGHLVTSATLEAAQLGPGCFDVVTMWHVLEHVQDPLKELIEIRRILRDRGILIYCIPNAGSLEARIFGRFWAGFDVPRHAYVFSRAGMHRLIDRAGFSLVETRSFFGGHSSFIVSLGFFLDERCRRPLLRKSVVTVAQSLCLRILLSPLFWLMNMLGRGSIIVYVLTKGELQQ